MIDGKSPRSLKRLRGPFEFSHVITEMPLHTLLLSKAELAFRYRKLFYAVKFRQCMVGGGIKANGSTYKAAGNLGA